MEITYLFFKFEILNNTDLHLFNIIKVVIMHKIYILTLFFVTVMFYSCTKEDVDFRLTNFNTPVIEGYYERNEVGIITRTVGEPNVLLGDNSTRENSDYYFTVFPNPCRNFYTMIIKAPEIPQNSQMWIVQAQVGNQIYNSSIETGMNLMYAGGAPLQQFEITSKNFLYSVQALTAGYYRIYLKINDQIFYDNLVVYESN